MDGSPSLPSQDILGLLNQLSNTINRSESQTPEVTPPNDRGVAPLFRHEAPRQQGPSGISTYQDALKYVVAHVTTDTDTMARIKDLVQDQQRREAKWHAEREAVVKRQQTRRDGRKDLHSILKLVGAQPDFSSQSSQTTPESSSADDDVRELARFDDRVYRDAEALVRNQTELLREMGIPLFCAASPVDRHDQRRLLEFLYDLVSD